jgi:enoyl-CoA hydratase/carnithine racemase
MSYQTIRYETDAGVATVTLDRPDVLNAMNETMRRELTRCFTELSDDDDIRVIVVTGAGRAFCAGADIKEWTEPASIVEDREERGRLDFREAMHRCPQPIIAAINGYALGGGCELAMCCDLRIASDRAQLGLPR